MKQRADKQGTSRRNRPLSEKATLKPNPASPHSYPRRVLLAVTGLSPQVVTETVYALTMKVMPAFVPTEVQLLTTADGADRARLTLLSEKPGWFRRLREDYALPDIRFDASMIHPLKTLAGVPIADIRTREENERLADELTEMIRDLTRDPSCALHVSIAGGRKTMGFYAGYVLSLFGRPQDRLSHVLVSDPFESNPEFYYPRAESHIIYTKENRPIDAREAEVSLAEIPFVRLRQGSDTRLIKGSVTFSQAIASAQRALEPPLLEIDLDAKCIYAGGHKVHLSPVLLIFLSWLARRAKAGRPDVTCPNDGAPDHEYQDEYLAEYANVGDVAKAQRFGKKEKRTGMDKAFFLETKSKLQAALAEALGPEGARKYGVLDQGRRPNKVFRAAVPPESIRWLGEFASKHRKLADSADQGKADV